MGGNLNFPLSVWGVRKWALPSSQSWWRRSPPWSGSGIRRPRAPGCQPEKIVFSKKMCEFLYLCFPPVILPPLRTPCSSSPPRCWPLPARLRQSATGPSPTTRRNSPRPGFPICRKMKISVQWNIYLMLRKRLPGRWMWRRLPRAKQSFRSYLEFFNWLTAETWNRCCSHVFYLFRCWVILRFVAWCTVQCLTFPFCDNFSMTSLFKAFCKSVLDICLRAIV